MVQADNLRAQLDQWRLPCDDVTDILVPRIKRLPPDLRSIAFAVVELDAKGKKLPYRWRDEEAWQKANAKNEATQSKLEKLTAAKRQQIFACIAPKLAAPMEKAWQHLKVMPYVYGPGCFRAAKHPELTFSRRVAWLSAFARNAAKYDPKVVTLPWLALWAPHALGYQSANVVPLLTALLNEKTKQANEVYEILRQTVTRETTIGIIGQHVIEPLMQCNRPEAWELMEKTLLAAQRQEGLRQSIVQVARTAHPDAFQRMLRLILDEDLIRFSSVGRSVNLWFGLLWDSAKTKVFRKYVEEILELLSSSGSRKAAVQDDNPEVVYRGLWAMSYYDAPSAVKVAQKLLNDSSDEIRFIATWSLALMGIGPANRALQASIDDSNLQIAMLAAVRSEGIEKNEEAYGLLTVAGGQEANDKDTFARLERLYKRLPEKPKKLAPIVWPWTERKINRAMVAVCLLNHLGDRPPTDLLPYMKGLNAYQQQQVVELLSLQKKWSKLTRSALFDLAGHASASVRGAAFRALAEVSITEEERCQLEGYLSRVSVDLRQSAVTMLISGDDEQSLASADRLLSDGQRNRRLAGLELLRQLGERSRLDEANNRKRSKAPLKQATNKKTAIRSTTKTKTSAKITPQQLQASCRERAVEFQTQRKKLTKEEQIQIDTICALDRELFSHDDAFGLMDPDTRSEAFVPQRQNFQGITSTAMACLKHLDDLVHKHRKEIVIAEGWRSNEEKPLGELRRREIPSIDPTKPLRPQRKKFPLLHVWEEWDKKRSAKLKDKDGFELARAMAALGLLYRDYNRFRINSTADGKIAKLTIGEMAAPKLKYDSLVTKIIEWLLYSNTPKGMVDYLINGSENAFAHVTSKQHQLLCALNTSNGVGDYHFGFEFDEDEEITDWRQNEVYCLWSAFLTRYLNVASPKLTKQQKRRCWELDRFEDEPIPGARRSRMSLEYVAECYQQELATFDDVTDVILGPGCNYRHLNNITSAAPTKDNRELIESTKGLGEWLAKARERILSIELDRGESATVATDAALQVGSWYGLDVMMRIMSALGKEKFKVLSGWNSRVSDSRAATLTKLIANTYPRDEDTTVEFNRRIKQAIKDGYCDEMRLLELAFLAPQWTKFVEKFLNWDGFAEGLYWFLAHMQNWDDSARQGAATAEGLENEVDDDNDDGENERFRKPRKLTAWERLVIERTPLNALERSEGAVDVDWFQRTWEQLGVKRWTSMANAAKFSANSAQAKKAQFLSDVLLGNTKKSQLVDGIKKRNLKDHVRLLGLLPLEKGAKRDKDVMHRYEVLQAYKKYARGLSSLTKPDALRALDIGFANLARLAGFHDPLRLEWALEAESVKDLASGPVSVTKDGITLTLSLDDTAKPELTVQRGEKKLKSIPATTKKKHAAIRDLADRGKDLRAKSSRVKQSLESAMCRSDAIVGSELHQLMQHAILAPQLGRLIVIGEGTMGYPDKGGKALRNYAGKLEPVKKNEQLRIAHPADLLASKKWDRWQRECFQAERVQPFKQVFRELYVVTAQEKKDKTKSSRFAGQQIWPRQAMGLWGSRGWHTQDAVFKTFHDLSLVAEVDFQWDYGTAAEVEGLTLETIRFRNRDEYEPIALSSVPATVFSEVMRDIDLVVSVAHRGEVDPEVSASTVELRASLISETCKLLGIKNIKIKKNHAFIDGHYGEYSLHLGSGSVQRMPGGALTILPVHAQHRGRLFLPFADDDPRTAEVVSKVLLLARDQEIQDPMILGQLAIPTEKRSASDEVIPKSKSTPKKKVTAAAAKGGSNRNSRYELIDGKSNKFWEVQLSGKSVTTSWGRIGGKAQRSTKTFKDESVAQKEYARFVKAKVNKGYKLT